MDEGQTSEAKEVVVMSHNREYLMLNDSNDNIFLAIGVRKVGSSYHAAEELIGLLIYPRYTCPNGVLIGSKKPSFCHVRYRLGHISALSRPVSRQILD